MCGIVGYISQNDKLYEGAKDHFMRYALALDTLRGEDSTGIMTLSKRFTVKTMHSMLPGDAYVHSADYKKHYRPGWAQTGHNRAATAGSVSIANAHPFTFGDITMVHNGTLWKNGDSLPTYAKTLSVDSMQIAYALSQFPSEKAPEVLKQIDGSFALVWYDRRDESINMCRNSERPLHFTFNVNKSILWYMSDGHHLHSINKSFGRHECKGQTVFEMDKMKILKFRKGEMRPEVIPFDPFVRVVTTKSTTTTGTKGSGTKSGGQTKSSTTALERASERWENTLANKNGGTTPELPDGSTIRVDLQGKKRKVPKAMQKVLHSELCLSPDDLLQFQPEEGVEMPGGKFTVFGTMLHREWGDTPWEMTIYNVPKVQYRAYKDADWLVRPIGIAHPHEFDPKTPAVLGMLIHCDWNGYAAKHLVPEATASSDDEKEDDSAGDILVAGPDGEWLPKSRVDALLENGCVDCGGNIAESEIHKCVLVNEGRDLMCVDCVDDMTVSLLATTTTIN